MTRIEHITEAARQVLALRREYANKSVGSREMTLDPILFAYLQARFGRMTRQHSVQLHGRTAPKRIDFRHGGPGPFVIELAVRSPSGSGSLYGRANQTELRKLTRVTKTSTSLRVLLLIDLSRRAIERERLRESYQFENGGPGNFRRHSVRVVYVHRDDDYNFIWKP